MASTPSIIAEVSPKHSLPVKHSSMEEDKSTPFPEQAVGGDTSPSHFQKVVAELIGTYVLMFIGCGAALVNKIQSLTIVGIALAWGLVLMAMIYAVGHVSGAHFNPAVTVAFAASRKLSWKQVPFYVLSQVLGATLASLTLKVLFSDQENIHAIATQYTDATSDLEAITWEFIITFILMFTICGVATDHRASKDFAGVIIGATLVCNIMIAGPITGASMNPARSLGPAVASGLYKNLWVYIITPIIGATAAALIYSVLRVPKPEKEEPLETKSIYNQLYLHVDP
ncbi:aquaporin NIP1-1-like [Mangifera indica]|uniref:aquaporin NIP1-1-like n=1 Tax=Mangifera indica TaxID=29780 RepID=UPI001CFABAE1|nr:aquaporin NIP1-1-like [Mangifera indica]